MGKGDMKLLKCIIRPNALDDVKEALNKVGIAGMTVSEVKGYGRQKGHKEVYRGAEYQIDFIPKLAVEVVGADRDGDNVVNAVMEAAKTGEIGDGKIFSTPLEEAVRIRTGETGEDAL